MNDLNNGNNENDNLENVNIEDENIKNEYLESEEVKKPSMTDAIKASFTSRKFRGGAYATTISAIVIIMVIVVNIIVTQLGLKVDVSNEGMYTITDVTKDYVNNIKDDITIYYLVQSGNEDDKFTEIVNKYPGLSKHIKVEFKDPILYPNFAKQYVDDTISDNSVLVVNETNGRAKYVDNSDMLVTEIDYQTYQSNVTGIDVEGQITSAIQYVTTDDLPLMYMVQGHGETEIGTTLASALAKVNVKTDTLSTLTVESIPEDCSILLINAPQNDYSSDEVTMIKDYLSKGGDAIILADYRSSSLENFNSLLNYYGVSLVPGIVLEGSQGYYMGQYVNNLVPKLGYHDITSTLSNNKTSVVVPTATGIQTLDSARSTIEITPLMTTSDSAYSKIDINSSSVDKEDGDIDGPFSLGVAIDEKYNDVETKLVVYGSSFMLDESMVSYSSIGNLDLFLNSVNYVADAPDALAVRTVSVEQKYLTMNAAQVNFWAVLIVAVIPVLILACGGYVCIRRRKR